jgi:predicted Zn-dependent protease
MTTAIIRNFEKLLADGKDNTLLRFSLGNEYLKAGEYVSVVNHLKQAVVLDPKYSAAWKLLGRALVESGQPADALGLYAV